MQKDDFKRVIKSLGLTTPKVAEFLEVSQSAVNQWRTKSGPEPKGPVIVALRLECERRGIEWPIK